MLDIVTKPVLKLEAITKLFEALHDHRILYCHWKSNEHLAASMQGQTDLDVLFAADQRERVEELLGQLGFKQFSAIRQKRYKDIVDFLAIDSGSGRLIHLHTHYRLTMGEPYLKGYQFTADIEEQILNERVYNDEFGIYCIQPAFELILLFLRESLKLRHRDRILMPFRKSDRYNVYVLREFRWLKERTQGQEIRETLEKNFPDHPGIAEIIGGEFNYRQLHRLAAIVKRGRKITRLYTPYTAIVQRWYREATIIVSRKLSHLLDHPILSRRINPRGGRIIALVGADGSGKSTVTQNLKTTFEGKLDVFKVYFGRGDGKASRTRRLLQAFKEKMFRGGKKPDGEKSDGVKLKKSAGFIRSLYKCVEALLVAREKRRNLSLMQLAQKKGALVICDRYPQNQIMGFNDGPLLHEFLTHSNPVFRWAARSESRAYEQAQRNGPDIIIKLIADASVVEKRKPGETPEDRLRAKIDGIRQLRFNSTARVVTIDAALPLQEVLAIVKKEVWEIL